MRPMIISEQSKVNESGERRGRSEQSKNITERNKSRAKREEKIVRARYAPLTRGIVWGRADQTV